MGACLGVCPVVAFAVEYPEMVESMVLYWPVGGAKYRINNHQRFANHVDYAERHSLADVAALAASSGKTFGEDPRGGPWASVLCRPGVCRGVRRAERQKYMRIVRTRAARSRPRHGARGRALT
jgi:hypothetical protein